MASSTKNTIPPPATQAWDETFAREPFQTSNISMPQGALCVVGGPHDGFRVTVGATRLHVGRADWCDISLAQDGLASRHHCELLPHPEGLEVRDLGSRNGISIDGNRIFHGLLVPGKQLKVGNSKIALEVAASSIEVALPHHDKSKRLVGRSESMQELFSLVEHIAPFALPVLILGETGTGKTSCARAIHDQSKRAGRPFVHVNCGALSPTLIESSLFGYEKGAFTHAHKRHKGFFEQADGGTLFLDEIGELPLELQPKLLDVIERKKLRRLGAEEEISVNFRLISATHQKLRKSIADKTFREDLFYRIAVAELSIPPLREHLDDLPLLLDFLMYKIGTAPGTLVTEAAIDKCQNYLWPGNVRQLRNTLERALLFAKGLPIQPEQIKLPPLPTEWAEVTQAELHTPRKIAKEEHTSQEDCSLQERLESIEKKILQDALEQYHWNAKKVQEQLQISKSWYYTLLKRHTLQKP